jgi:perosamine synthetase
MIPHSRPWLLPSDVRAVAAAVRSGRLSPAPVIEQFESAVAGTMGTSGAAAVSSGTAALYLTLRALRIGPGDEVLFPSYVCSALLNAVTAVGATPRLVEIDPSTFNIAPDDARKKLRRRTKALVVPHLFGLPAELKTLSALGPPLIEDCAQTMGVSYRGHQVGSFGVATICSFYATKLVAAGEGGMVASSSAALLDRVRAGRAYDERSRWQPAFNFKLSALHAALGLSQLRRLPRILARRRRIARQYDRAFAPLDRRRFICPVEPPDRGHGHYRYVVRVPGGATRLLARLAAAGIAARRPVFRPTHRYLGMTGFPLTDHVWREALSLPIYPGLTDREVRRIIATVVRAVDRMTGGHRTWAL